MKKLNTVLIILSAIVLSACGDKSVSVQDIQHGVEHVNNISNSKNASEAIANVSHGANDILGKINASGTKSQN